MLHRIYVSVLYTAYSSNLVFMVCLKSHIDECNDYFANKLRVKPLKWLWDFC